MKKLLCFTALLFLTYGLIQAQKVFRVEYESQAGWRNKNKQHLLL